MSARPIIPGRLYAVRTATGLVLPVIAKHPVDAILAVSGVGK